jgi:hypothetical protein
VITEIACGYIRNSGFRCIQFTLNGAPDGRLVVEVASVAGSPRSKLKIGERSLLQAEEIEQIKAFIQGTADAIRPK